MILKLRLGRGGTSIPETRDSMWKASCHTLVRNGMSDCQLVKPFYFTHNRKYAVGGCWHWASCCSLSFRLFCSLFHHLLYVISYTPVGSLVCLAVNIRMIFKGRRQRGPNRRLSLLQKTQDFFATGLVTSLPSQLTGQSWSSDWASQVIQW